MSRLRRFLGLTAADRRLLVGAAVLLVAIRGGQGMVPFRTLRRLVARGARTPGEINAAGRSLRLRIAWAVEVASRYVPRATCLTRALAVEAMLMRRGYPARLCIGVARKVGERFEAHAWVESDGKTLIGLPAPGRYTTLNPSSEKGT